MKRLFSSVLAATLVLSGCNGTNAKPQADDAATGAATASATAAEKVAPVPQKPAGSAVTAADFERLESRFTLAQEQLLGLISQNAQTQDSNNRLVLQLQAIQNTLSAGSYSDESGDVDGYDTSALDTALEQLLLVANDMGANSGANTTPFAMAMTYIGSGKWKVIRYNRSTGETWLARGSDWQLLEDSEVLPESSYEVKMISGGDLLVQKESDASHKGFIAARLDRTTGRMWWLNQDRWQAFGR